ncbi:MAG: ABC transporter ATP-binding protein, partial [Clostridia bacterium]
YVIGGVLIFQNEMTIGQLFTFVQVLMPVTRSFGELSDVWTSITEAVGSSEHFFKFLDADEERTSGESYSVTDSKDMVQFKNVSFSYTPQIPLITDVSFTVKKGEKVAIVGVSGCGKSTLHKLILGYYENYKGEIIIGDHELKQWNVEDLRSNMSSVFQDTYLFNNTIKENVRMGNIDADDDQITDAIKKANAMEFVSTFENGIDSNVGERGSTLSGGQKQRIVLARAILKNAPILLLDEPTSALDSKSEYYIQQSIQDINEDITVITIAHRLSTIINADKILVLDEGRIVETGNHETLISKKGKYFELYERQLVNEKEDVND